jgi:hypothetical protein
VSPPKKEKIEKQLKHITLFNGISPFSIFFGVTITFLSFFAVTITPKQTSTNKALACHGGGLPKRTATQSHEEP